jgi:heat-inducible transcriptional repressor
MDDRRQRLLSLAVESFISSNRPVASRDLAEALGVSSATVRSELAALEEMGLLHQPHTSAGRVPTRAAYRSYAHRFIPPQALNESASERLEGALARASGDGRLKIATQIASHLSGYAVMTVAASMEATLEAMLLSALPDGRVLAVILLSGGDARELIIDAGFRPERTTIEKLEQAFQDRSIPLRDVPAELGRLEQASSPGVSGLAKALRERWSEASPKISFSSGARPVLGEPESANVNFIRNVLEILEQPNHDHSTATLGQVELVVDDPNGVSKITVGFRSRALKGSVVIVGPTRMRYPQAISVAKAVSDALGAA